MRAHLLQYIYERNASQEKKLTEFLKEPQVLDELDVFLKNYKTFMERSDITIADLGDAYLKMVEDMCTARLEFTRTGKYPRPSQEEAKIDVYDNQKVMTGFMLGLGLSQFLWRQHFDLFRFYRDSIKQLKDTGRFLEVGSGHGLFLNELLKVIKQSPVDVVDISETSLHISKEITSSLMPEALPRIKFFHQDIMNYESSHRYDFITMGEVLEHVENPKEILQSLDAYLNVDGRIYISTCTNCPTLDHVYHFETLEQIRALINDAGFQVESEVIAPAECCSMERLIKKKIDIVYGAILKRI